MFRLHRVIHEQLNECLCHHILLIYIYIFTKREIICFFLPNALISKIYYYINIRQPSYLHTRQCSSGQFGILILKLYFTAVCAEGEA